MTTNTANGQDFNSEMKKTDLGSFLMKNTPLLVGLLVLLLAAIAGYGIVKYQDTKKNNESASMIFNFQKNDIIAFKAGKLDAASLVKKYTTLGADYVGTPSYFNGALVIFDDVYGAGNAKAALALLSGLKANNSFQAFFLEMRKATVLEELGRNKEAIASLNKLTTGEMKLMEGKVYLDLGRLYLSEGNKDMAKKSFEYVLKTNTQKVYKSIATEKLQAI